MEGNFETFDYEVDTPCLWSTEESLPKPSNEAPESDAVKPNCEEEPLLTVDLGGASGSVSQVPPIEGDTSVPILSFSPGSSPFDDFNLCLNEDSARKLLNDSGWNVTQSMRRGGFMQWYYRSPPPKTTLAGSLTSALALWKKMADEKHKKEGGGDEDPYPSVTAFLRRIKDPPEKKRKRGRPCK